MKRFIALSVLLGSSLLAIRADENKEKSTSKEALQAFNDFIGTWKGSGEPKPNSKDFWSETLSWKWRFKGDDAWLVMKIDNGKFFKGAELRYLPDKKRFQLTATNKDGKKLVFAGVLKDDILTLDRVDQEKRETQRIKMNLAAEGARFIYRVEHRPAARTVFYPDFQVACTKEGESLGGEEKKVECIITGGLGKIAVSYKGQTYYVCCTGCKDAFEENPEKFIKAYEARKAGKK
jgi:hypothetical protein